MKDTQDQSRAAAWPAAAARRATSARAIAVATAAICSVAATGVAGAASPERCGRAVVIASNKIVRTDTRALGRCALAALQTGAAAEIEETCSRLRTPGLRVDRLDAHSRARIERRCEAGAPAWLPTICPGPGPAAGIAMLDGPTIARCVTASAHCAALATLDITFADPITPLEQQHPDNLRFGLGGVAGNNFAACLSPAASTTTLPAVTTTLPAATTTTLGQPTTTTLGATTTTLPVTGVPMLVITEIMANPAAQSDAAGEYFEVFNAGTSPADLAGLVVADQGSDSFTVDGPLVVAAGSRVVFGKSATAAGGTVDHVYGSGMNLTNSSDEIVLSLGSDVIDAVAYDGSFPAAAGRAIELSGQQTASANDDPLSWCLSDSPLGDGDFGTPGAGPGPCAP